MKSGKIMSKMMLLGLVVMLVLAMSVPAFAQDYLTSTSASYIQGTAPIYTDQTINVDLVVESRTISGSYIYTTINNVLLTAGETAQSFFVRDVLLAVQDMGNYTFNGTDGNPIDSGDSYFYSVTDENSIVTYGPTSQYAWDGWVFRINNKFPLESAGLGASIATAYVTDGDVINIYHDDASSSTSCADFAKIASITDNDSNTLTVNVKASCQYYGPAPTYTWNLTNFANYQGVTVKAYNESGTLVTSGTTDSSGNVDLNVGSFGSHTYKVEVVRTTFGNGLIENTTDTVTGYDPI
ncbi:hypothetical protein Dtox_1974 [Desulfofarcimen acetoxidans DSM 771]|uniref:DUF4430 domain-containing protein n=1 Tax=Desulfofarcimen acetoxidans (strain ATCC 49208 / DSM 771 / KCTC 5769 / VKM B-1644 / 5575) TaxID=485916 RepID=C8VYC9_DESAS|nr:hypothetical protein [Desulfofarcimen acetoxidans]ACV62810.1 hypothetical protein Dtox_1974 [Desulfofarcimen acetoxidans DSM 771]